MSSATGAGEDRATARVRGVIAAFTVAAGALAAGCGDDPSTPAVPGAACTEDLDVRTTATPDVAQQGRVAVRDVVDTTWDAQEQPQSIREGRISASFGTVTATGTDPNLIELGFDCVGVVSLFEPDRTSSQTVGALRIEGLPEGPVTLEPDRSRYFRNSDLLLSGPAAPLTVSAPGDGFGPFSGTIPTVTPLTLLEPSTDGSGRLTTGELVFAWPAGNADYVELRVTPNTTDPVPGEVICLVADDGCFTLSASATSFLLSSNTRTFTVSLLRTNVRVLEPEAGRVVRLSVVSEVSATLVNGVMP